MVNAQEYLNQNYFDKTIKRLDLSSKNLEGELDLSGFANLEELYCSDNQLTNLKFADKKKITKLDIRDNFFRQKDLSFLNEFTNLESLKLGRRRTSSPSYLLATAFSHEGRHLNSFGGSLEPLKNMTKLKELSIVNTDINEGLKYLPESLEVIKCGATFARARAYKCSKICEKLKGYELGNEEYDLVEWRKDNTVEIKDNNQKNKVEESETAKSVNAQEFINQQYPKTDVCQIDDSDGRGEEWNNQGKTRSEITKLNINSKDLAGELNLSDFPNLEELDCSWNNLTKLNLNGCKKLKKIRCWINQIPTFNLSSCSQLEEIECNQNNLTNLDFLLTLLPNNQLANLVIYHNPLNCSLAPLQNCPNLKKLEIRETNINADLQYLPPSLEEIIGTRKINEELSFYGDNLIAWQEAHPELMKQDREGLVVNDLKILVSTPEKLNKVYEKSGTGVTKFIPKLGYEGFVLRHPLPFSWEKEENGLSTTKNLPTRLYNIEKGKNKLDIKNRKELEVDVEETKGRKDDIKKYATMSYVCGLEKREGEIYANARKSLNKVIKTLEMINKGKMEAEKLKCVWIDQLCIIQDGGEGIEDKKREIPKMKQYYNDSKVTLIAIDGEIGEKMSGENECELAEHIIKQIVASSWFTRSWTFQEGLLSKQTIFMFDDGVVDGRILASAWSGLKVVNHWINKLNKSIFVTPLGWSYGASSNQTVNLRLTQALDAVKHRKQTVSIDGIYALLGLLPYGSEITPNYKGKDCSCSEEEKKNCQHWPKYTKEDLNKVVFEIMKKEVQKGYFLDPISWLGIRQHGKSWWAPEMNEDGSSTIEGLIDKNELNKWQLVSQGIKLVGDGGLSNLSKGEKGYITVGVFNTQSEYFEITIPQVEKATYPIVFTRKWRYTRDIIDENPFSLLIDMINKEVIVGENAIDEYLEIRECFSNQRFIPLSRDRLSIIGHPTFDNHTIFQSQGRCYILDNDKLQEVIKNSENEWEYKSQELQAQIQVNTNQ